MAIDITATKPAKQPGNPAWATNGGTRSEPTAGQKATGFTIGQRPTFLLMNWLIGFLSEWTKYNEDAGDELDSAKLSRKGAGASTPQGMIGTLSSERDATDDCGATATRWATVWTYFLNVATGIVFSATAAITATKMRLDATADTSATGPTNTITTRGISQCNGLAKSNGAGVWSYVDGKNSAVALHTTTKKNIRVTFTTAMADTNYRVALGIEAAGLSGMFSISVRPDTKALGFFDIALFDATGAMIDADTILNCGVTWDVKGAM